MAFEGGVESLSLLALLEITQLKLTTRPHWSTRDPSLKPRANSPMKNQWLEDEVSFFGGNWGLFSEANSQLQSIWLTDCLRQKQKHQALFARGLFERGNDIWVQSNHYICCASWISQHFGRISTPKATNFRMGIKSQNHFKSHPKNCFFLRSLKWS